MTKVHVFENDYPILKHLLDVQLTLHEEDEGFELKFLFSENEWMTNTELVKNYFLEDEEAPLPDKIESSAIEWKEGKNVTIKKISVKKKKKKKQKVEKEVEADSFFNFFKSHDNPDEEVHDSEGEEAMARMDDDWEIATAIKEDLLPLALEYYLGVADDNIEDEMPPDDEESEESDDSAKPKKKKK